MFNTHFNPGYRKEAGNNLLQLPFIAWTEQMRVDVKLLDNDHKRLAILTNDLYAGVTTGRAKLLLVRDFETLAGQIRDHFAREEQLFAEFRYPGAAIHAQQHDILTDRIRDLRARFKRETELAGLLEIMNLLKGWLFGHIQSSDQKYVPYLKVKNTGFNLAPRQGPFELIRERMTFAPRVVQGTWPA
jgi:hemerythrin-like metal-binding protein